MSVDSARGKMLSIQKQIAQHQKDKSRQAERIADLTKRASSAYQAALKASSASTTSSKMREYDRFQRDIADTQKKIADFDDKVSREYGKLASAQKDLSREEDRQVDQRLRGEERRARDVQQRMHGLTSRIREHDDLHEAAMSAIERLSQLPEQITVLFLASNPVDQPQLRLDEEVRLIGEMIRKSEHRDSLKLESCWAVRPLDVLQAINEHSPRIVHFSGHGSDQDEIVLQDQAGNAKLVSKEALAQTMMAGSGEIQLVFFNTCSSHRQAEPVVDHVAAAIGMKAEIGDEAARVFAAQLYSAVVFGKSVRQAYDQARAALMLEGISEENTPVLFVGDGIESEQLF